MISIFRRIFSTLIYLLSALAAVVRVVKTRECVVGFPNLLLGYTASSSSSSSSFCRLLSSVGGGKTSLRRREKNKGKWDLIPLFSWVRDLPMSLVHSRATLQTHKSSNILGEKKEKRCYFRCLRMLFRLGYGGGFGVRLKRRFCCSSANKGFGGGGGGEDGLVWFASASSKG